MGIQYGVAYCMGYSIWGIVWGQQFGSCVLSAVADPGGGGVSRGSGPPFCATM